MIVVVIEDSQIDDDNDNEHYFGISKATTVADGEDQGFST